MQPSPRRDRDRNGNRDRGRHARGVPGRGSCRLRAQRPDDRGREDARRVRTSGGGVPPGGARVRTLRTGRTPRRRLRCRPRKRVVQRRRASHHDAPDRRPTRQGNPHPRSRLACASCSSATSSGSPGARSRGAPCPHSSSASRSTSSSRTSRTPRRGSGGRPVPALIERESLDFVIANVENSGAGFGVTGDIAEAILSYGVDAMTTGNHVWDKKEIPDYFPRQPKLLRPANFPAGVPGRGSYLGRTRTGEPIGVVNVMGRIFMQPLDDPFAIVRREIDALRGKARVIIVDFHAEATSEKVAMGWHLDGRATGVFGTHTHVQTADDRILPNGTAYLTDVGMTGPHDSIIGVTTELALGRFLTSMPAKFESATGPGRLNAVLVTADQATGRATAIERLNLSAADVDALAAQSATEP